MDKLNFDLINSLSPLCVRLGASESWWLLEYIDVESGALRIDVCGLRQIGDFEDVQRLLDCNGDEHDPEEFYNVR